MIYSEDLHRYIYNMIPIIERFNLGNVNTFFNNLYKKMYRKIESNVKKWGVLHN